MANFPQQPTNQMPGQQMPTMPVSSQDGATNEELIEAIIDEKWNELLKDINKIIEWKTETQNQLVQFEQQIKDMRDEFDKLHQAVVGKVGEYDKHILEVGAEIQAMEKVFSKVLPAFTNNVSELSRITDDLVGAVSKKK